MSITVVALWDYVYLVSGCVNTVYDYNGVYITIREMQKGWEAQDIWPLMLMMDERWLKNVISPLLHCDTAMWICVRTFVCVCVFVVLFARCDSLSLLYGSSPLSLWCGMGLDEIPLGDKTNTQCAVRNSLLCFGPTSRRRRHVSVAQKCWHLLEEPSLISRGLFNSLVFQYCSLIYQAMFSLVYQPTLSLTLSCSKSHALISLSLLGLSPLIRTWMFLSFH